MLASTRAKLKVATVAVLAILCAILILQNTAAAQTKVFFWTVSLPRIVLLIVAMVIGFAVGVVVGGGLSRKK